MTTTRADIDVGKRWLDARADGDAGSRVGDGAAGHRALVEALASVRVAGVVMEASGGSGRAPPPAPASSASAPAALCASGPRRRCSGSAPSGASRRG